MCKYSVLYYFLFHYYLKMKCSFLYFVKFLPKSDFCMIFFLLHYTFFSVVTYTLEQLIDQNIRQLRGNNVVQTSDFLIIIFTFTWVHLQWKKQEFLSSLVFGTVKNVNTLSEFTNTWLKRTKSWSVSVKTSTLIVWVFLDSYVWL